MSQQHRVEDIQKFYRYFSEAQQSQNQETPQTVEETAKEEEKPVESNEKDSKKDKKEKNSKPWSKGEIFMTVFSLGLFGFLGFFFYKLHVEKKRRDVVEDAYADNCPLGPEESVFLSFQNNVNPEAYKYLWELLLENHETELTIEQFYQYLKRIGIDKSKICGRKEYERLLHKLQKDLYESNPEKYIQWREEQEKKREEEERMREEQEQQKNNTNTILSAYHFVMDSLLGLFFVAPSSSAPAPSLTLSQPVEVSEDDDVLEILQDPSSASSETHYEDIPIPISVLMASFLHLIGGEVPDKIDVIYDIYNGKKGEEHMSHEDYQHLISDLLACYHLNSDYLIETDKHNYSKGIIFDDFHLSTPPELVQQSLERREKIAKIDPSEDINREELKAMLTDIPICIWGECNNISQHIN